MVKVHVIAGSLNAFVLNRERHLKNEVLSELRKSVVRLLSSKEHPISVDDIIVTWSSEHLDGVRVRHSVITIEAIFDNERGERIVSRLPKHPLTDIKFIMAPAKIAVKLYESDDRDGNPIMETQTSKSR